MKYLSIFLVVMTFYSINILAKGGNKNSANPQPSNNNTSNTSSPSIPDFQNKVCGWVANNYVKIQISNDSMKVTAG